ncbi:MAG: ATP-dependent Clp protease ATP-binding subunit ClpA [Alphaproteobacteria bacterium]|nr:ATP-dependent Clp protease ATP-binding subunit ClpA [Alphaproteobacteria bacterium]MCL2504882.1 ATP-dependent Clp protease ATP-binding subunit ClpA [Alphaproteobacteria bacterium]
MISKNLAKTLHRAVSLAFSRKHEYATLEHMLLALMDDPDARPVLIGCGVDMAQLRSDLTNYIDTELEHLISRPSSPPSAFAFSSPADSKESEASEGASAHFRKLSIGPQPTTSFQRVIQRAIIHVQSAEKEEATGASLLVCILSERDSHAVYFLNLQNISRFSVIRFLSHKSSGDNDFHDILDMYTSAEYDDDEDDMTEVYEQDVGIEEVPNPAHNAKKAKALARFCVNLNAKAKAGDIDPLIGRSEELERTMQILCRRHKNNPVLVGDSGVGKTAIVEGLARNIVNGEVPKALRDTVIFSLDMGSLLAGAKYRGDMEERIKAILKDLKSIPNSILFIDEIHTLVGSGSSASSNSADASDLLKPALASGSLRCVGSTTYKDYRSQFEKDPALARRFQKIDVKEPSVSDSVRILMGLKPIYEKYYSLSFTDEAIKSAVHLADRYINERKLPDKAIDVLDEVGASQKLIAEESRKSIIDVKDIEMIVSKLARIPQKSISSDDKLVLQNLDTNLRALVFGQNPAIDALVSAIKLARSGLRDHEKPIGSYLFSGPTGVGKTEVAKQLAITLGIELKRFDMSEYMEKHSISRLIGAPPGYVGFDQGGLLTDAVDQHPYCVLLLDEIEKAHPDIFNILLQVMDNGMLTDHNGKTVNFRNTILIMTTNAGSAELSKKAIGFERTFSEGSDKEAIEKLFSPEFRNRLDAVIQFAPLPQAVVERVVEKFILQLETQLQEKNVIININDDAKTWLANKGYDAVFGARPLARVIQEYVKRPLSEELLFGRLQSGGRVVISLDKQNSKIVFDIAPLENGKWKMENGKLEELLREYSPSLLREGVAVA